MKKLLVFAAVAAMGIGAYAEGCAEDVSEGQVYQVKMILKTTQGLSAKDGGSVCGEDAACVVYRIPDRIGIYGWMYACEQSCGGLGDMTVSFWDPSRKAPMTTAAFEFDILNIIGTDNRKAAETAWTLTGSFDYKNDRTQDIELRGAGFGKYTDEYDMYLGFNGFAAGKMGASYDLRSDAKHNCCEASMVWQCDSDELVADVDTAVYGKWAMRLNTQASAAFAKVGVSALKKHSPKYAVWGE